jgi:hypothetical protein
METITKTFNELAIEYQPYHAMGAFGEGAQAYMDRIYANPYTDPLDGVDAQAWDRGAECASRYTRQHGRYA